MKYHGKLDLTVWLLQVNEHDPVIYPEWPIAEGRAVVGIYPLVRAKPLDVFQLLVARTRTEMLAARGRDVLWFCNVPIKELITETNAREEWFDGPTVPS